MHALIIREPWISFILAGTKTWEMRTKATKLRGPVGLIRKGTGLVVGVAEIVDCLSSLDAGSLAGSRAFHRIPAEMDVEVLKYGWVHPWVLCHARALPRSVPAGQKPGQVTWVPLSEATSAAVAGQYALAHAQGVSFASMVSDQTEAA